MGVAGGVAPSGKAAEAALPDDGGKEGGWERGCAAGTAPACARARPGSVAAMASEAPAASHSPRRPKRPEPTSANDGEKFGAHPFNR